MLYSTVRFPTKICPFHWESPPPLEKIILGPTQPSTLNSISIVSTVIPRYTREINRQTNRNCHFVCTNTRIAALATHGDTAKNTTDPKRLPNYLTIFTGGGTKNGATTFEGSHLLLTSSKRLTNYYDFGIVQCCFILKTSVDSIFIKFIINSSHIVVPGKS